MSLQMTLMQGVLVRVVRRQNKKTFDPIAERARSAKLVKRLKPKPGVREEVLHLGGIPCRRFSSPGGSRGVFFHLHGGAYVSGSSAIGRLYTGISAEGGPDLVSVDYRLAPEDPYPASIDDALAAYLALLDTVPSSHVVVGGESAGGNLVLALVQRLLRDGLPLPAAVVPVFPWADLTQSSQSWTSNALNDILSKRNLDQCAGDYAGPVPLTDPSVSPLFGDFTGFPPALIHVGTHDCLLDDARGVAQKMRESEVPVVLREVPGAVHGFTLLPVPETRAAYSEIRAFVVAHLTGLQV